MQPVVTGTASVSPPISPVETSKSSPLLFLKSKRRFLIKGKAKNFRSFDRRLGETTEFLVSPNSCYGENMKMKSLALNLAFALLACLSMLAQDATTATTYTFQTVDYPGDIWTQLLGVNNNDVIAGYHGIDQNSFTPRRGFTLVLPNHFTDEMFPNSTQTVVTAINDQKPPKTVGFYIAECDDSTCIHGFEYARGHYTTVDFPGLSGRPFNQLLGQNNQRQSVGYYSTNQFGNAPDHAYIYDECGNVACTAPGVFELLVIPDSKGGAQPTGINDAGNVCGFYIDSHQAMHGFLLISGTLEALNFPEPSTTATAAFGLNNVGQVVGMYKNSTGSHGFVYTVSSKTWQTINDPDGLQSTVVNGINDKGVLVGFYGVFPHSSGFVATP